VDDAECMVGIALESLSQCKLAEAKRWGSKAAKKGNIFASDILGHTAMMEKDFKSAHEHFVKCWASPLWQTKEKTAYYIAECYFEREMFKQSLRWAYKAITTGYAFNHENDYSNYTEVLTLCAQIEYLRGNYRKCLYNATYAKEKNMLAAFIYAMCAYRKVGGFRTCKDAPQIGSAIMHELKNEGYLEAIKFFNGVPEFDSIRHAYRNVGRGRGR
jgi:hypothetical protein